MSQLSLNQTYQSLVTGPESRRKTICRNSGGRPKTQVCNVQTPKGYEDNISIGTTGEISSRMHKLGYIPGYLKKQTKSTVESELVNKYKKFKIAKRDLIQQQSNLKKNFEHLHMLKDKFKKFGGRDFKIENLELIEFTGGGNDNGCGDGDHVDNDHQIQNSDIGKPKDNYFEKQIDGFEQEIRSNRGRVKDSLMKLIELNSEIFTQVQQFGSEELQIKIHAIFSKIDDYVKSMGSEQDMITQFILANFQHLTKPIQEGSYEVHSGNNRALDEGEIVGLRETVQNLEVQGKMLQSEIDVKNREIEYLMNKETCNESKNMDDQQNELHTEILAQKALIDDYTIKLNQYSKEQEMYEEKIRQLEHEVSQRNEQLQKNLLKYENDLSQRHEKCEQLGRMLEEVKKSNNEILHKSSSNYELVSHQLATAHEDVKELQFKICKREKQIQNLKQILNTESNKAKEYDHILHQYEELRQQEHNKSQEINQLKEQVVLKTDTINSQILTISELKKALLSQGTQAVEYINDNCAGPLQEDHISKLTKQERIIEKLENNKIRSNVLRDQLLDRICMLEKENEEMKVQIRKFHEEFTINRYMYDEQRRKKRLTEILVKQYQK